MRKYAAAGQTSRKVVETHPYLNPYTNIMSAQVSVHKKHLKPLLAGHPWVFKQAIKAVSGGPVAGDLVTVVDENNHFIGKGFWSPTSAIAVRIVSRLTDTVIDRGWFAKKIQDAYDFRKHVLQLPRSGTTAFRLIHAEGDGLPGLIADQFGETVCVQLLIAGMKIREQEIFGEIARITHAKSIVEIAAPRFAALEGFESEQRIVRGPAIETLAFKDAGFDYEIALSQTQKTGFYLDQRPARSAIEHYARGREVLDAFCYLGSFSLAASRGGAKSVYAIERSAQIIQQAAVIAQNNHRNNISFTKGDVKKLLPQLHAEGRRFDFVILDPPKLVPSVKHLEKGLRSYRSLNVAAMKLLRPGGLLLTCSCSAALQAHDFQRMIAQAAIHAKRQVQVINAFSQGEDHPVAPAFSEGRYLKSVLLRIEALS